MSVPGPQRGAAVTKRVAASLAAGAALVFAAPACSSDTVKVTSPRRNLVVRSEIPVGVSPIADCSGYDQPGDEPGLAITACDPQALLSKRYSAGSGHFTAELEPALGDVHNRIPLRVSGINPGAQVSIHPLRATTNLRVYIALTPPRQLGTLARSSPQAVLFPPLAVSKTTRLTVHAGQPGVWTLSDANGQTVASAHPTDYTNLLRPPRIAAVRIRSDRRHLVRGRFTLRDPYDGEAFFIAGTPHRNDSYWWQRLLRSRISYGATEGSFSVRMPTTAKTMRFVVVEGNAQHASAPLRLP